MGEQQDPLVFKDASDGSDNEDMQSDYDSGEEIKQTDIA
jgi:hypothetical protein